MSNERLRNDSPATGPGAFGDEFAGTATATEGQVDVTHGVYAHSLPLAGMTVRHARAELEERLNIDPEAIPIVDGEEADEDMVLVEGQMLNFVKHAGEKGT